MRLLTIGIFCMLAASARSGTVLYVDDDAPPGGDGSSWDTAYRFLQDALAHAGESGEVETIRVAQGRYLPDRDETNPDGTGERSARFELVNGVSLMGGYAGLGAGDPDARDVVLYETILSGDLAGDDGPGFVNIGENSLHVVSGAGSDATAVLDGFTISGGNADDARDGWGGGMCNEAGSPTLIDCTFTVNTADMGGGMYNTNNSNPVLAGCTFAGNRAEYAGGGMYNSYGSNPALTDCTFSANVSLDSGAGMYSYIYCEPMLIGCTFDGNFAALYGGGLDSVVICDSTLIDCAFTGNVVGESGGGMLNDESTATAINCTFAENKAARGGGISNNSAEFTLINGVFHGNLADRGAAMANFFTSPDIVNCTFSANTASEAGGALHNEIDSNAVLFNCILWDDDAPVGPEIANVGDSVPRIGYCDIQDSGGSGGGWDEDLGVDRGGNIDADPLFIDPVGDFRLSSSSPCIDAGINSALPADALDLDDDGDTAERVPIDRAGAARMADDPDTPDTGCGVPVIVDMGAYEFPGEVIEDIVIGDIDGDGDVDVADLLTLLGAWGPCEGACCLADLDFSGAVDTTDLLTLLGNWG